MNELMTGRILLASFFAAACTLLAFAQPAHDPRDPPSFDCTVEPTATSCFSCSGCTTIQVGGVVHMLCGTVEAAASCAWGESASCGVSTDGNGNTTYSATCLASS